MRCRQVLEQLNALLDGELRFWREWTIRRHLSGCPGCARELEGLREMSQLLWQERAVQLPEGLRQRLARSAAGPVSSSSKRSRRPILKPVWVWATGGLG